jgi:hypothetical protein
MKNLIAIILASFFASACHKAEASPTTTTEEFTEDEIAQQWTCKELGFEPTNRACLKCAIEETSKNDSCMGNCNTHNREFIARMACIERCGRALVTNIKQCAKNGS